MNWNNDPQAFMLYWERRIWTIVDAVVAEKREPTLSESMKVCEYSRKSEKYKDELQKIKLKFKIKPRKMKLINYLSK